MGNVHSSASQTDSTWPLLRGTPAAWAGRLAPVGAVLLLTGLLRIGYGRGWGSYDPLFALFWGRELARGELPSLAGPAAPTPHPLSIVEGAMLAPLGDGALDAVQLRGLLSLALLGYAGYRLGRALFSPAVGVLAAALLLTRPTLVYSALQGLVEVPFLALIVLAASLHVERRDRAAVPVLVLLALAGLLRPEAWLLSVAYVTYLAAASRRSPGPRVVVLALAAPVLWAAFDLAATGDPLHSLHGTQDLAARLERPRGIESAVRLTPVYLDATLGTAVLWCGFVGALAALHLVPHRAALPLVLLALGLGGFLVLGVAQLPLLTRYLLVPGVMLTLFCAVGVLGWQSLDRGTARRSAWIAVSVVLGVLLVVGAAADRRELAGMLRFKDQLGARQRSLHALIQAPGARADFDRCRPLLVRSTLERPQLAFWLDRDPGSIAPGPLDGSRRGVGLRPAGPPPPAPFKLIRRNGDWEIYENC